jgi:hypothetical protein
MPLPLALLAAGAAGSALGGYLQGRGEQAAARANARTMRDLANMNRQEAEAGYSDVQSMYSPYSAAGVQGLQGLQNWQATQSPEAFSYGRSVNDFLDPSVAYQMQQQQQALEASAASRGGLLSSGATRQLSELATKLAQTDYGNAYNRMAQDKAQTYQQYIDLFNNQRAVNLDRYNQLSGLANIGQNATANVANARLGQQAQNIGANTTQMNAANEYAQVRAAAPWNTAANVFNAAGNAAGTYGMYKGMNPSVSAWDRSPFGSSGFNTRPIVTSTTRAPIQYEEAQGWYPT